MSHEASAPFDVVHAHRHFAADCYNRTWTLIEKPDRTEADNEAMILCALTSLWHWTQRPDRTDRNLSIGHWQVSRVYSLLKQGDYAMRHAQRSLALAAGLAPFYVGYAHEAVARAAVMADAALCQTHLQLARACSEAVTDPSERAALDKDLLALARCASD